MAEPTEGQQTSEYKLARVVMIAGAVVDTLAIILEGMKTSGHFPAGSWLPTAMGVVGTLAFVLAQLGYTRSRTMVKLAEAAPALGASLGSTLPLAQQAAKEVATYSAKPRETTHPSVPPLK